MSTRLALLEVTARLFADHGWRGTTTSRIAAEAGVNEVTLFRHFRSKEALLNEAVRAAGLEVNPARLPEVPSDPRQELLQWGGSQHSRLRDKASLIRTCLAEFEEHPSLASVACEGAMHSMADAIRYLGAARERRLIGPHGSLDAATVMLMNAIFMDAITRDVVADCQPMPSREAIAAFIDLTLRALGAREAGMRSGSD